MKGRKRFLLLLAGPGLLAACILLLPRGCFPEQASRTAIGAVAWMAFWWVTVPVDYAVTALLPIAFNALFQITDMASVIANYASETILLLLGASILTASWEQSGLDQRIALRFLSLIGNDLQKQVIFWFLLSAGLSSVLPNTVVCAAVTPIAVSMLRYAGQTNIAESRAGSKLLLTVVYAAGVGGLATPLGGAMNLVVIDYIQQLTGQEFLYMDWVYTFFPIMLVLVVSNILFLIRDIDKGSVLGGSREYVLRKLNSLGKMSHAEAACLVLFAAAVLLSFTRQLYQNVLPGLRPAYSFVICAVFSFLIPNVAGGRLMDWKGTQGKIVWELIYIFAGGLAAGTLVNGSGAARDIGQAVSGVGLEGGIATIFAAVALPLLLSDMTSNTAAAAVAVPVVISIIQGIGKDPVPYIYASSVGVNLSYMLPTSIRAIPVGYGLSPQYMFREGWKLSVMALVLMTICCKLLFFK